LKQPAAGKPKEWKVTPASNNPVFGNLLEHLPAAIADEAFETLAEARSVRIERITSRGHASRDGFWYDQPQAEFVVLVSGEAHLEFEGDEQIYELKPGDHVTIPARCRHRVAWTTSESPTIWLAVHYEP
jgi:cupin 2 domain-containing protein